MYKWGVNEVVKTTRKIVENMYEAKGCANYNEHSEKHQWAWITRKD